MKMERENLVRTALAILACGGLFGGCASAKSANAMEMTIMSFNVRHCRGSDKKLDVPRTAAVIAAAKPRFAALQEIDFKAKRSERIDEPAELARLTGMKATFGKTIDLQGGEYGVMLLSAEEPISVTKVPLPGKEPRLLLLAEAHRKRIHPDPHAERSREDLQMAELLRVLHLAEPHQILI